MQTKTINQYNFFKNIKLTPEGYVEMVLNTYAPPKEPGIDQYSVFKVLKLDSEGRIVVTQKH